MTSNILAPPLSPCNLPACWEKQQGILGKTGGGLSLNTNNICVYVCEADGGVHILEQKFFCIIIVIIISVS